MRHITVKTLAPLGPISLPNKPDIIELIRGKNTITKYIMISNNGFEPLTFSL